jgi:hypothetical protein
MNAHRTDLVAPSLLTAPAQTVVPWLKRYAARTGVNVGDCFEEGISALLRADGAFRAGSGT